MKELIAKLKFKKVPNVFNLDTISTFNEALDIAIEIVKHDFMMKDGLDENGLKFCPFCGHQAELYGEKWDAYDIELHYHIKCPNCKTTITTHTGTHDDVISHWNTRN